MAESSSKKRKKPVPGGKASECPMCGTSVPGNADECPKCGEPFTPEAFEKVLSDEERGSKRLFFLGVLLVLIGGPGVALGSWVHDVAHIPIGGDAFDNFGWLNELVSVVGIIILVVGIILLILSLPKLSKTDEEDEEEVQDSSQD